MIDIQKLAGVHIPGVQIDPSRLSELIRVATGIRPDQIAALRPVMAAVAAKYPVPFCASLKKDA